jgi:hypothetical protein
MHQLYAITENRPGHALLGEPLYVGITGEANRKVRHFSLLRDGKHWNADLQKAFLRHTRDGVEPGFKTLAILKDRETAEETEKRAIACFGRHMDRGILCNLHQGGNGSEAMKDPILAAKNAESNRKAWKDPDRRARGVAAAREAGNRPIVKAARALGVSERNRQAWADPVKRAKRIEAVRAGRLAWCKANPEKAAAKAAHMRAAKAATE